MRRAGFLLLFAVSCSGGDAPRTATPAGPPTTGTLLDVTGELRPGDTVAVGGGFVDGYEVAVPPGVAVTVSVRATAVDAMVLVQPPQSGVVSNDDFGGDRTRAEVEVVSPVAGTMKVTVAAAMSGGAGPYRLTVAAGAPRAPGAGSFWPELAVGVPVVGSLAPGDTTLPTGQLVDGYLVPGGSGQSVEISVAGAPLPLLFVTTPSGQALFAASDGARGRTAAALVEPGPYRVQVVSSAPGAIGSYTLAAAPVTPVAAPPSPAVHHQTPPAGPGAPLARDTTTAGRLEPTDGRLTTGEPFDRFTLEAAANEALTFDLQSSAFDPYLIIVSPSGRRWENDDANGGRNAQLAVSLPEAGSYQVIATSYQAGERGDYVLKVHPGLDPVASPADGATAVMIPAGGPGSSAPAGAGRPITGELRAGDRANAAGKLEDRHTIRLRRGEAVRIELVSSEFDTMLVVRPPSGAPVENDDVTQGNTNSAVDLVAQAAGSYTAVVTSFRPGEHGHYELRVIRGGGAGAGRTPPAGGRPVAPTPAGDAPITGTLAQGDATLRTGELSDSYTIDAQAGQLLRIGLTSAAFDPYVLLRAPSGHQEENDDRTPQTRDAGLETTITEPGTYTVVVTSYRPGESGEYRLTIERRTPQTRGGVTIAQSPAGGGRVFGVFAGISDYPSGGDLPECANDARKLAEDLRQTHLMDASQQIVLTDSQVTVGSIRQAFQTMAGSVGPNDTFLFFFSGHGNQRAAATDRRELDHKDETIVLYDQELVDDEMAALYGRIGGRVNLIALDSCFSGGFAKDVISAEHRMGMFSSEEDLTSAVAGQFQAGGYLSHFLRMAIDGEADSSPRDGQLLAGELQHYLFRQFAAHAGDVGATDQNFAQSFQHLVVDRGAVHVSDVLFTYR